MAAAPGVIAPLAIGSMLMVMIYAGGHRADEYLQDRCESHDDMISDEGFAGRPRFPSLRELGDLDDKIGATPRLPMAFLPVNDLLRIKELHVGRPFTAVIGSKLVLPF
jgi:hypothetical protein